MKVLDESIQFDRASITQAVIMSLRYLNVNYLIYFIKNHKKDANPNAAMMRILLERIGGIRDDNLTQMVDCLRVLVGNGGKCDEKALKALMKVKTELKVGQIIAIYELLKSTNPELFEKKISRIEIELAYLEEEYAKALAEEETAIRK